MLAIALAGCSDNPAAPNPYGAALPISVTAVEAPASDLPNVLFGGPGPMLFTIYGRIVTPNPCYDLSAYRTLSGRELKITIVATPHPKGCASSIDHFDYQVLTDAPVCPHLTVWHHYDGSSLADVKVGELDILCGPAT
ncbi:MAG: hypothetical protein HOQ12_07950 [Gemmatimonadaceae bacterium]|nr:hypothetical protein [Gemmatimonadaceae bacterium]